MDFTPSLCRWERRGKSWKFRSHKRTARARRWLAGERAFNEITPHFAVMYAWHREEISDEVAKLRAIEKGTRKSDTVKFAHDILNGITERFYFNADVFNSTSPFLFLIARTFSSSHLTAKRYDLINKRRHLNIIKLNISAAIYYS